MHHGLVLENWEDVGGIKPGFQILNFELPLGKFKIQNPELLTLISSCGGFYEDVFSACELPFYGVYVFCRLA
jgi:hypothetical protein